MKPVDRRELIAMLEAGCDFHGFELLAFKCGRRSVECVVRHAGRKPTRADALWRVSGYHGEEVAERLRAGTEDKVMAATMKSAMTSYGDVSALIRRVKGGFSSYYTGIYPEPPPRAPLWRDRFRSDVVQESAAVILAACAEVEKRQHLDTRKTALGKDAFSSFGRACAGDKERRGLICGLTGKSQWRAAQRAYLEAIETSELLPVRRDRYGRGGVIGKLSLDGLMESPANQPRNVAPRPRAKLTPASEHLVALRVFKKRFGHTRVPKDWPENVLLASWVKRCRKSFSQGLLAEKTEAALRTIDFDFVLPRGHPVRQELQPELYPHDAIWLEKFEELAARVDADGGLKVKPSEDFELYRWLMVQRRRWKLGKLGSDRVARLEEIGIEPLK